MPPEAVKCNPKNFQFRALHPKVFIGTASETGMRAGSDRFILRAGMKTIWANPFLGFRVL